MQKKKEESPFIKEYKAFAKKLDNLYWKKNPLWHQKYKQHDDEVFKKIDGFLGLYFISNYGQVVSFQDNYPLLLESQTVKGLMGINLEMMGHTSFFYIHELVYTSFRSSIPRGKKIVHKNGNIIDNYFKNLKTALLKPKTTPRKEKPDDNKTTKSRKKKRKKEPSIIQFDIMGKLIKKHSTIESAVTESGIARRYIRACLRGEARTAGGFQWKSRRDPIFKQGLADIEPANVGKNPRAKPVLQFDLGGKFIEEYRSIREAAKALNRCEQLIGKCARGGLDAIYGFQWKFKSDPLFANGIKNIKAIPPPKKSTPIPVLQFDLDGNLLNRFNSIGEAARFFGIPNNSIRLCLEGKTKMAANFQWKLEKDFKDGDTIKKINPIKINPISQMEIIQYDPDGNFIAEYDNIAEAAKACNITTSGIYACLRGRILTTHGYQWKLKNQFKSKEVPKKIKSTKKFKNKEPKPILQLDLNGNLINEFPSIQQASKAVNVSRKTILELLNGERETAGGFKWKLKYENSLEKNSQNHEKTWSSEKNKIIIQFDIKGKFIKEYPSIVEAANATGIIYSNISACLNRKLKTAGKYQWRFRDESIFTDGIKDIESAESILRYQPKPILQFDLEGKFLRKFSCISEAAHILDIPMTNIRQCARRESRFASGYQWRYEHEDLFKNGIVDIEPVKPRKNSRSKIVLQYDTQGNLVKEYASINEASKENNIDHRQISKCAKGKLNTAHGYVWKFKS